MPDPAEPPRRTRKPRFPAHESAGANRTTALRPGASPPLTRERVCAAEAGAQGKTLADHLTHLVVHGVLHLLGRDHLEEAEAEAMEAEERAILANLGVADPYAAERAA